MLSNVALTSNQLSALDDMSVRMIDCDFKRWNEKGNKRAEEGFSKQKTEHKHLGLITSSSHRKRNIKVPEKSENWFNPNLHFPYDNEKKKSWFKSFNRRSGDRFVNFQCC